MLNVKFKKEHPNAQIPVKGSKNAGAYDVVATEIIKEADDCYLVKLGFSVEFPPEYKLMIAPRSSITKTKWNIQNTPGIGDADFRGEYSIRFRAFPQVKSLGVSYFITYPQFPYEVGERCAQIYFQKVEQVHFSETEFLNETERGSGAYGSTGKRWDMKKE